MASETSVTCSDCGRELTAEEAARRPHGDDRCAFCRRPRAGDGLMMAGGTMFGLGIFIAVACPVAAVLTDSEELVLGAALGGVLLLIGALFFLAAVSVRLRAIQVELIRSDSEEPTP